MLEIILRVRRRNCSTSAVATAGYSGTPLAKKLGIKESARVLVTGAPKHFRKLLDPLPPGVVFVKEVSTAVDIAHVFATERRELARELGSLRKKLRPDAVVWVSWPKKSSGVETTITEDVVREIALPIGFVDIKVCAVNEIWSGLKLMVRRELR